MSHRVYPSLTRPILFGGAERELAILEGTLICALLFGVGLHFLTVAMAAHIAFGVHPLLVLAAKNDPQMFRIYLRSIAHQDLYLARAHPSAPDFRCLPWPPL
ncbi:MAG TPA: VirB3 family type IV secretion system protein [Gemmatimonadales bacterium]|nr:VirB3 family type IV secretion system protein [Gemmatimonadales bacterium]